MNQETGRLPWRMRLEENLKKISSRVTNGENGYKSLSQTYPASEEEESAILLSLISEVREIFPDYGDGFIKACLTAFDNNVETVIDQLLQGTLPPNLEKLDRSMVRYTPDKVHEDINEKEESPLVNRRNIFDNDEFDVFSGKVLDSTRVNLGKKNRGTAEKLLDDKSFVGTYKESIIDVACNMMYEDEYDDTYDSSGLKMRGIDLHLVDELDEGSTSRQNIDPSIIHEGELVRALQSNPSVFEKSRAAKNSAERDRLKKVTQMTDEQLEGWFIMFQRNPRKDRILATYEWRGNVDETQSSSESEEGSSHEDSPQPGNSNSGMRMQRKWVEDLVP
ncbi:15988_t:CDS:2 [Acaulospora morrowiae]|uniref:15988_t:CDS:1 n=1 Tax=Acaulospora morrowiae TaxID=94023 RepID=A0A9N8VLS5_9GLOM|nr:15988_t:CDS:2 [Acaulospora morrowiae]